MDIHQLAVIHPDAKIGENVKIGPFVTIDANVEMAVQVCGKLRGTIRVPVDSDQDTVVAEAMKVEKVARFTEGKTLFKVIHVKNKLVNLIVK